MNSAPPPPYGEKNHYQQGPPPPPMAQPIYARAPMIVGDYPAQCTCPQCGSQIVTRVEKKVGLLAWFIFGVLFFTFMWFCCFIPFCVDACKDTEHYCPNCNALLGVSKKM